MKTPALDSLLLRPEKITIPTFGEPLEVYVRRLTQVERDLCTAAARRASREMRTKLQDTESEERQLLVEDEINEYDQEAMRAAWVNNKLVRRALKIHKLSLESRDETFIPEPEGDDVMPADIEEWETAVEQAEEDREGRVAESIAAAQRELNEEAMKLSDDDLRAGMSPALIDTICSDIWTNEYVSQMVARGTFLDKDAVAKPAFKSASDVKRLQPKALQIITQAHMGLLVEPEAVKN